MTTKLTQSTTLIEARERVSVLGRRLKAIFEAAGPDIDLTKVPELQGDMAARVDAIKAMNRELSEAHDRIAVLQEMEDIAGQVQRSWEADNLPAHLLPQPQGRQIEQDRRTLGERFIATKEYGAYKGQRNWPTPATIDIDIRAAVFRTGAGWNPEDIRLPRVELDPQRPIAVVDSIPMLPTGLDTIRYMEETTFTNNAAETAESTATTAADLIGEAALALTERTQPVEWLPVFIPVTMQQMEDVEGIGAYVDSRLRYMLRARLDLQILRGTGVTPLLLGLNSVSGINTQAKGSDPTFDAIYKGHQKIRSVGFAEPSVQFLHPNDWQDIRLTRTADGIYILGNPADPGPDRLWGVPVVQTTAALENTASIGDLANFAALYTKRGITVEVSDSHAFYFTRGMLAIRADMRVAAVWFRPEALCTVTGI